MPTTAQKKKKDIFPMFALFLKNRTKQKTKTFLNYFKLNIVVSPKRCNFTHI